MNESKTLLTRQLLFPLIVLITTLSFDCPAQSIGGGGSVQGTVRDASGSNLAGAKLTIRNIATGVETVTIGNSEGSFITPTLPIGRYRIRVEATGMKAWQGELVIETGRVTEVNPTLSVGDVNDTVIIEGNITPLVNATDPTVGSTLDSRRIKELPVNGRNINALLEDTVPGLEANFDVNGGVRANGLMGYSTDYVQDGAASNNREFGGSGIIQGLESIGEVRVETSTSSAKYNRPTSVVVTTKGGQNELRFTAFETHRNNGFGVARARQDVLFNGQQYKVPTLLRNEYGFSASGPVYLPKPGGLYNGKNRTFWFFSRESLRLKQGITREFVVPTEAWRKGDFSGLQDSLGRNILLYDPATTRLEQIGGRTVSVRTQFPNNIIPISRISPLAKAIFEITPLPTDPGVNPLVANNYKTPVATNVLPNRRDDQNTIRIDHRFSEKDTGFLKINGGRNRANFIGTATNTGAPTLNNEANVTYLPMEGITGATSWVHLFSTRFFVETLVNRTWQSTQTVTGPTSEDFSKKFGLPNPLGELGFPNITGNGFMNFIEGDNRRALYTITTNAEQNFSWLISSHKFEFGWRFNNQRQHYLPDQGAISGSAAFSSLATALHSPTLGTATNPTAVPQTGYDAANFFLGAASTYTVGLKRNFVRLNERYVGFYFQDSWRINDRLTINGGARWDMFPAFKEAANVINAFDVKTRTLYFPDPVSTYVANGATTQRVLDAFKAVDVKFASAQDIGLDSRIFKSNLFDIGPRGGFAYRLFDGNKQMVVRGGYGMYISNTPIRTLLAPFFNLAPFRANFTYNPNSAAQSPDGIGNYLLRTPQTIIAGSNTSTIVDTVNPVGIGRGTAVAGMAENQRNLRVHDWNLAIEKQLTPSTVIRFTYQGKHGVNADQQFNLNPQANDYIWYKTQQRATPTGTFANVARRIYDQTAYTNVIIYQKTGYINTSMWTAEIERRFSKGLSFQGFYTMTNALRMAGNSFRDDTGTVPSIFLPESNVPQDIDALNRFLFYDRDTGVPKHRIRANWNYDLPFGKGQWLGRGANDFLNGVIGGWKMVGKIAFLNTWYAKPTSQWGEFGNFEIYGKKYRITDCRSTPATATQKTQERCTDGYLWFNGYIPQRLIGSYNAAGLRNGVFGLPDNYKPAQKPIYTSPVYGQPVSTDPNIANDYDTNVEYIPLNRVVNSAGQIVSQTANCNLATGPRVNCQRIAVDTGLHPWRNQYHLGPFNSSLDVSMMKFFRIREKLLLRVNIDIFNVLNLQGLNVPSAEGIVSLGSSYGANGIRPRQVQGTLRLEW